MQILITVTDEIIQKSKNCCNDAVLNNCAVALAIREIFPKAAVGYGSIQIDGTEDGSMLNIGFDDEKAIDWIMAFDGNTPEQRSKMIPFSFEIEVPSEVINQIGIEECYKILSESKTLELVSI